MNTVTLSTKNQLVIPRDVRDRLALEPGTKLTVIEKGGILYLVPEKPLAEMRGLVRRDISEERAIKSDSVLHATRIEPLAEGLALEAADIAVERETHRDTTAT